MNDPKVAIKETLAMYGLDNSFIQHCADNLVDNLFHHGFCIIPKENLKGLPTIIAILTPDGIQTGTEMDAFLADRGLALVPITQIPKH